MSLEETQQELVDRFMAEFGGVSCRMIENHEIINILKVAVKFGYLEAKKVTDAATGLPTNNSK